jgi:flagellar hook-basal body complex protein FliE
MGKTSAREVVDKVMTADQTLQTAMAFRDKIVSAYLELVKMPI